LLGFQDEGATFVEIDAAEGLSAIGIDEDDATFEDVGVVVVFLLGWFRSRNVEQVGVLDVKLCVVFSFV
jgi:hypothetical protein